VSDWPAGDHLAAVYDALYLALGEGAPTASTDALVVRLHEASRAFGALALEVRRGDTAPDPMVYAVLHNALAQDETGVLAVYALAMVVGPRLLVTLRDYSAAETDEFRRDVLARGSDTVVREIRAVGESVATLAPVDDPAFALAARAIHDTLDDAGMAESLGQRG